MKKPAQKADNLLIISRHAGTMDEAIEQKLRQEFAGHLVIDFDPNEDFEVLLAPRARVVVAGGDGTVEFVVRKLADTDHPVGILPLGTFNNLAHALGLPVDLEQAVQVVRAGHPRAITFGRVNGHVFVEACAIGLFGDAIVLGDFAKDLEFGAVVRKLKEFFEASPFQYELSGDLQGKGVAMSLVFSNTSSIGSQLPISDATPLEPYLEFSADAGQTRADIIGRVVASALLDQHAEESGSREFRFRKVQVETRPEVRVYADNQLVGHTPATITAEVSALKVLLPAGGSHQ